MQPLSDNYKTIGAKNGKYKFPKIYNFPPFFTPQPNLTTYQAQLEQWEEIILGYCKANKVWILSETGSCMGVNARDGDEEFQMRTEMDDEDEENEESERTGQSEGSLFKNQEIKRQASSDFIMDIYGHLIENKHGEWVDETSKSRSRGFLVYWHPIEEWAHILYDWIDNSGQGGSILTVYELQEGELSKHQEFHGMPYPTMVKVLTRLAKQGKASLMEDEAGLISGVKFRV